MLDYLKSLKRNDLIKLYSKFGSNATIKQSIIRHNNKALIDALVEEKVLTKDVALSFFNKDETEEVKSSAEIAQFMVDTNQISSEVVEEITKDGEKIDSPDVMISRKVTSQEQHLREVATKMKKEALETLVVTISPTSENYLKGKKNAETIFFANQFFSLAKLVPFNVKCELPRCIVEIAMEAVTPTYTAFDDLDTQKRTGRLGVYKLTPKYNVIIHGTAEEVKISEENKKRLGL